MVTSEIGDAELIVNPITRTDGLYNPSNPNLVYTKDYFEKGIQNGRIPAITSSSAIHQTKTVRIIDENNNFAFESDIESVKDKSVTNSLDKDAVSGTEDYTSNASTGTAHDEDYFKVIVKKKRYSFHSRKNVPLKVKIIRCIFMATILTAGVFFLLFPPVYHWQLMKRQRETNSTTSWLLAFVSSKSICPSFLINLKSLWEAIAVGPEKNGLKC